MPTPINTKLFDEKKIIPFLSKKLKKEMLMRDLSGKEVARKADYPETYLSGVLGTRPTNNADVYRRIAKAIWLTSQQFDDLVKESQQEAFGGGEVDFDFALSSKYWNSPQAMEELKNFAKYINQKYWIKE